MSGEPSLQIVEHDYSLRFIMNFVIEVIVHFESFVIGPDFIVQQFRSGRIHDPICAALKNEKGQGNFTALIVKISTLPAACPQICRQ